jgi:glycosyltransferase involved in cell wall biosynthesis
MLKRKLLYIAPHLSTGGQPQYLYKQIECFKNEFEIEVVEINNVGGEEFAVQKNRIRNVVPLHILGEDKSKILDIINKFNPDIIHFQEIPQFDLSTDTLNKIFDNSKRSYKIVVTTHGSHTNPNEITHHPDRYVLVSEWSRRVFESTKVETSVWEYPIENYTFNKDKFKKDLGFESDWKHVLNVGLFSPGKNQAEIFKIAKELSKYKIKFHFIGNQAGNFESYWGPLMKDKPDNCIVWGERNDVDKFYAAADMFYFSSKLELNPLSVKEALSYRLPSIFRKLHTYLNTYDGNQLVTYINDDLVNTKQLILNILQPELRLGFKPTPKIQIKHLLTTPYGTRERLSMKSIRQLESYGMDYVPIVNEVYKEFAPKEHCRRPDHLSPTNEPGELWPGAGLGWITGKHYGCYLAHKTAVENLNRDYDYTLVFEADAYIYTNVDDFVDIVYKACEIAESNNVYFLSFADNPSQYKEQVNEHFSKTGHNQDLAHAYLVRNKDREWWNDRIKDCEWDVGDLWFNHIFYHHKELRYTTNKLYSNQAEGYSLLDNTIKTWQV